MVSLNRLCFSTLRSYRSIVPLFISINIYTVYRRKQYFTKHNVKHISFLDKFFSFATFVYMLRLLHVCVKLNVFIVDIVLAPYISAFFMKLSVYTTLMVLDFCVLYSEL